MSDLLVIYFSLLFNLVYKMYENSEEKKVSKKRDLQIACFV